MQAIVSVLLREQKFDRLPRELLDSIAEYAIERPILHPDEEPRYIYKNITYQISRFDTGHYRVIACRAMHGRNLRFTAYRYLLMTYDMDADQLLSITALPNPAWRMHIHNKNIAVECEGDFLVYTYYVDYRFNLRLMDNTPRVKYISGIYNQYHIIQTAREELRFYKKKDAKYMMYVPGVVIIYEIQKNIMTYRTINSHQIHQADIKQSLIQL